MCYEYDIAWAWVWGVRSPKNSFQKWQTTSEQKSYFGVIKVKTWQGFAEQSKNEISHCSPSSFIQSSAEVLVSECVCECECECECE